MLSLRLPRRHPAHGCAAGAAGAPAGAAVWLALSLLALSSDALASPLSVVATSVGPLFALGVLVVAKAHGAGSLKAASANSGPTEVATTLSGDAKASLESASNERANHTAAPAGAPAAPAAHPCAG